MSRPFVHQMAVHIQRQVLGAGPSQSSKRQYSKTHSANKNIRRGMRHVFDRTIACTRRQGQESQQI